MMRHNRISKLLLLLIIPSLLGLIFTCIFRGETVMIMNNLFGPCEYVDVMAPDWKNGQMNIVMKDKSTNVLQLIVHALDNL